MLAPLLLGSLMVVGNMAIQIWALLLVVGFLIRRMELVDDGSTGAHGTRLIGTVVLLLFLGHLLQFATWAVLFVALDEFQEFSTAFYHSSVNFTSLGYGDIVMSERWRLLGGLEAANGVLMFGLSAGAILSMMNRVFMRGQHLPGGDAP
ncbi:MAG: ion channel [Xanthomonadales bacterium]|nr:ion channel [Xanthomonadales bacterium]